MTTTPKLIFFLLVLIAFFNCEGIITGTGKVVSSVDNRPLDNVLIIWTSTNDSCFTDSLGNFKIGGFVGCVPECPKLKLLFHKQGYKNQYIDLSENSNLRTGDVIVKMQPTDLIQSTEVPFLSKLLYFINIIISIINIGTLIYLFTISFEYKFLWIIFILWGSLSLHYNFYTNIFNLEFFNFLIQLSLNKQTGLVKTYLLIPLGSVLFWIFRWKKKNTL